MNFCPWKGDVIFTREVRNSSGLSHVDFWSRDLREYSYFLLCSQNIESRRGTGRKLFFETSVFDAHVTWKQFSFILNIVLTSLSPLKFLSGSHWTGRKWKWWFPNVWQSTASCIIKLKPLKVHSVRNVCFKFIFFFFFSFQMTVKSFCISL